MGRLASVATSEESKASESAAAARRTHPKLVPAAADHACTLAVTVMLCDKPIATLVGEPGSAVAAASIPSAWTPGVAFHGELPNVLHVLVGPQVCSMRLKLVSCAIEKGKTFDELTIEEYKKFSPRFEKDVYSITVESSVAARDVTGGTSPKQVEKALAAARRAVEKGE